MPGLRRVKVLMVLRSSRVVGVLLGVGATFLVSVSGARSQSPDPQPQWKTYAYPADGFSASFPAEPKVETDAPSRGVRVSRLYILSFEDVALLISVYYADKLAEADAADPDAVLQGFWDPRVFSGLQEIGHRKLTLDGYHGLEVEAENSKVHEFFRFYLVGPRIYMMQVISPPGKPYGDTDRFQESFRLIPSK